MAEETPFTIENCPRDLLLFRAAVRKIFREISESVSEEKFFNSWTILKNKKKISRQLYASMVDHMCQNMEIRMDEFIVQDELVEKFNKLKKISEETNETVDHVAWRPPGNVMEHLRPLDARKTQEHTEIIEDYVNKMEAENQKLMKQVAKGRSVVKLVDQKADRLLNQQKRLRTEFEKSSKQIKGDTIKMHT